MAHASFDGLRVLSLESRRAVEVGKLIRTYGGEPFVVPAMREVPLESNGAALEFADRLMAGEFDLVIFMTGVGVRALFEIMEKRYSREALVAALGKVNIAARGVKPMGVLKEFGIAVAVNAPEPSTWRELLPAIEQHFGASLRVMRAGVQEYGATNPELVAELSERCASVTKVPVYQWALPEDLQPLREAVLAVINGGVDVVLFMTAVQVIHLFQIAEQMGCQEELRAGLRRLVVVSIGPTTSEELSHYGITADFEPSRPKMGFLVNEAAQYAAKMLESKRNSAEMTGVLSRVGALPTADNTSDLAPGSVRVPRVAPSTPTMAGFRDGLTSMDFLHEISSRIAQADSFHVVLNRIVAFVTSVIPCDSCFIYVLESEKLVLRASKNPHEDVVDRLGVPLGQGVTGWVAEHREPVAIGNHASDDPRFKAFKNLPEDSFEAMLCTPILCASKVVGVMNVQHRLPYRHSGLEVRLLSMLGFLVGAEVERARLETENAQLADRLETRKAVDRAKGILQRDQGITEDEAYRTMQRESRQRRKSMRELAEAILLGEDLRKNSGVGSRLQEPE